MPVVCLVLFFLPGAFYPGRDVSLDNREYAFRVYLLEKKSTYKKITPPMVP